MKFVTGFLILLFVTSCSAAASVRSIRVSTRVAYLVQEEGQLPRTELDKHPEILVTHSFEEFQKAARQRISLWIDKNAIQLVEEGWLDKMPQASYPIVLVGTSDTLYSFRDLLGLCCFQGPGIYPDADAPGFSVIERKSGRPVATIIMLQGFKQTPTVDDILKISNDLLDEKIIPIPTASPNPSVRAATAGRVLQPA